MKRAKSAKKQARAERRATKGTTQDALAYWLTQHWDKLFATYAHKTGAREIVLTSADFEAFRAQDVKTPMTFAAEIDGDRIVIRLMTRKAYAAFMKKRDPKEAVH